MLKNTLRNSTLRKRARQFGNLVRRSAVTPRTGRSHKPKLVTNDQMGLTFIGHSGFFVQLGGFDTHDNQAPQHARLLTQLGEALEYG